METSLRDSFAKQNPDIMEQFNKNGAWLKQTSNFNSFVDMIPPLLSCFLIEHDLADIYFYLVDTEIEPISWTNLASGITSYKVTTFTSYKVTTFLYPFNKQKAARIVWNCVIPHWKRFLEDYEKI